MRVCVSACARGRVNGERNRQSVQEVEKIRESVTKFKKEKKNRKKEGSCATLGVKLKRIENTERSDYCELLSN